jgi:hypothetical protein
MSNREILVLHPRHKLQYFEQAGWEPNWIETAEEIVRAVFEESYAVLVDGVSEILPPVIKHKVRLHKSLCYYLLFIVS